MARERELLPLFTEGEALTIQRNVNGKNVLMSVVVRDPSSVGPDGMRLIANMVTWGESSYADGRVANQKEALDRLMEERKRILEIAIKHGVDGIVDILVPTNRS